VEVRVEFVEGICGAQKKNHIQTAFNNQRQETEQRINQRKYFFGIPVEETEVM